MFKSMQDRPLVIFIDYHAEVGKFRRELDGIRRFAKPRGWRVATLDCAKTDAKTLPALLSSARPGGCIVECSGHIDDLPPRIPVGIPAVYLDPQRPLPWRGAASVACDDAAVAEMAFREISAGLPKSCATVGYWRPLKWSNDRVAALRALCAKSGLPCEEFPRRAGEASEARSRRLAEWAAALPPHCAVFAVNDDTAYEVARAFREVHRVMPHSATLLGVDAVSPPPEATDLPPISSVRLDFEHAGYLAAKMLAGMFGTTRTHGTTATNAMQKGGSSISPKCPRCPKCPRPPASFGPLLVERRESTGGQGRREPFALKAVDAIRREACDGLTAERLAKRFTCSRHLFEMRFREATGHSVGEEIIQVRLERAMDLLSQPDIPIADIATLCGFRSDRALRKLFLSRLHVSMRRWRSERS